jgi:hypothetical protein
MEFFFVCGFQEVRATLCWWPRDLRLPVQPIPDWTMKQQCCLTVSVRVSANSAVILQRKGSKPQASFNLHIVYMTLHACHVFLSLPDASIPRFAEMFRLVLGCLISDTKYGCDFRGSEVRNVILYKSWCFNSFLRG